MKTMFCKQLTIALLAGCALALLITQAYPAQQPFSAPGNSRTSAPPGAGMGVNPGASAPPGAGMGANQGTSTPPGARVGANPGVRANPGLRPAPGTRSNRMSVTVPPPEAGPSPQLGGTNARIKAVMPVVKSPEETAALRAKDDAEVMVEVNGEPVYQWQLRSVCSTRQEALSSFNVKVEPEETIQFQRAMLTELVDGVLLAQEAQRRGMTVTEAEIHSSWLTAQNRFGTEAAFKTYLSRNGITESAFIGSLKNAILLDKLGAVVGEDISIDDKLAQTYYANIITTTPVLFSEPEMTAIRDIFLRTPEFRDLTSTLSQVEQDLVSQPQQNPMILKPVADKLILERKGTKLTESIVEYNAHVLHNSIVQKEATFTEMAKKYSDDQMSRDRGGDLGFVTREALPQEVADIAFNHSFAPGFVSRPIRTRDGFHIIQIYDRKPMRTKPYEEVKPQIYQMVYETSLDDRFHELALTLRDNAKLNFLRKL